MMTTATELGGSATTNDRLPPLTPAALEQEVTRLLGRHRPGSRSVVLLRALPQELRPFRVPDHDLWVRVVSGVSVLDIWERVTGHLDHDGDRSRQRPAEDRASELGDVDVLVILTAAEESKLGDGLLSRVYRQRVHTIEPWRLIQECFGVQHVDPRLASEGWASQALLDAMPSGGWSRLPGPMLTRDTALRALAARRLSVAVLGVASGDLDFAVLLRWSLEPDLTEAFRSLPDAERRGIVGWLGEQLGAGARLLFALVDAGRACDAVPLGIVCAGLWRAAAEATGAAQGVATSTARAQGRVLDVLASGGSGRDLTDDAVRSFAEACEALVARALRADDTEPNGTGSHGTGSGGLEASEHGEPGKRGDAGEPVSSGAGSIARRVLDRADQLVDRFDANDAVPFSRLLASGLRHRLQTVAAAILDALDGGAEPERVGVDVAKLSLVVAAVDGLRDHALASTGTQRLRRAEMGQRLLQWLASDSAADPAGRITGVGAGVQRQIDDWAWVDRALAHMWWGDPDPMLARAYRALFEAVQVRRRAADEAFAARLAAWTRDGSPAGDILTVESVLDRVIAPVATSRVLLLVLDGMSAAVATDLAEQLRRENWDEYQPCGADEGVPRRRGVVAALPTVTRVSRASLFAGRIATGDADRERTAFEARSFRRAKPGRLFHKGGLVGGAGEPLSNELLGAIAGEHAVVAAVLNTIDDSLERGRSEGPWSLNDVAGLPGLLDLARAHSRMVVITADHGHVLEHGTTLRAVPGTDEGEEADSSAVSARYRTVGGPAREGEVELRGSRVCADRTDGSVVALWDPGVRYTARKAGYHGGVSLAEVAIPLLAFCPFGAIPPKTWRPLADQSPEWWWLTRPTRAATGRPVAATADATATAPGQKSRKRTRTRSEPPTEQALFPVEAAEPAGMSIRASGDRLAEPPGITLVEELLSSELFAAQEKFLPRKIPRAKVEPVLTALLDSGTLPLTVVAERAGQPMARAPGFISMLQKLFNVENYPVLTIVDDGRSLSLNRALLLEQFGLEEG